MDLLKRKSLFNKRETLNSKEKAIFYDELYSLLSAGMDLYSAIDLLDKQTKAKSKNVYDTYIQKMKALLGIGYMFSDCVGKIGSNNFEEISIKVGETAGYLNDSIKNLALFYKSRNEQKRKLISALSYPLLVMTFALFAIIFMLVVIVPMFEDVYKSFGSELPQLTVFIINIASSLDVILIIIIVIGVLLLLIYKLTKDDKKLNKMIYGTLFKIPLIGNLIKNSFKIKFFLLLGTLLKSKVPIYESIKMLKQAFHNVIIRDILETIELELLSGHSLYESMRRTNFFELKSLALIHIGEQTNQMAQVFTDLNIKFSKDIEHKTTILNSFLEPFLIIMVGGMVGLILIALYLPIFDIGNIMG